MREPTDVDLLLIGKTGNGKSATGNSILRRKVFKFLSCTSSVTQHVDYEVSEFNGRVIKVVDGPGVGDTRLNNEKAVDTILSAMEYAIVANPRGYHAFCLVMRFGVRFTKEDKDTIDFLKKIFGQDLLNFCILVMTCGDIFEKENGESGQTFKEWCRKQEGAFKELLNECGNRIVLFDNATNDVRKKEEQAAKLLEIVDNLSSHGNRYTDENFQKAKEVRDRIIIEAQIPYIQEETMNETSLILQQLENILLEEDMEKKSRRLEHLQTRADSLLATIISKDRETGMLHELISTVKSIVKTVGYEIKCTVKVINENAKMKTHTEEIKRKCEKETKKQKEKLEKQQKKDSLHSEEQRKFQNKLEKMMTDIEKKYQKEIEEMERKLKKQFSEEQSKLMREFLELKNEYRKVKAENDKSFFGKIVNAFTWPFRKIASWF